MKLHTIVFALATASAILACGETDDDSSGGTPAGAAGESGAAGSTGSEADFQAIEQCAAHGCERSVAHKVELTPEPVNEQPARCVLTALRDRTPGVYRHDASQYTSSGEYGTEHVLRVTSDGSVLHVHHHYNGAIVGQPRTDVYSPVQRCQLRAPAYFQACIDAIDGTSAADDAAVWTCLFGDDPTPKSFAWVESCAPAPVSCD
jgi:hypothetical protein